MYHDAKLNKLVYMLEDSMIEIDTERFEIISFDGSLFAAALADSWEFAECIPNHLKEDEKQDQLIMKEWLHLLVASCIPLQVSGCLKSLQAS